MKDDVTHCWCCVMSHVTVQRTRDWIEWHTGTDQSHMAAALCPCFFPLRCALNVKPKPHEDVIVVNKKDCFEGLCTGCTSCWPFPCAENRREPKESPSQPVK